MKKRTVQKDTIIDITSDSQVNSNFPYRWSPASFCGRIQNNSTRVLLFFAHLRKLNYSEFLRTYAEKLRAIIIILRIYAQFNVLAFLRAYAEKLRKTITILAHLPKLRLVGVSADVRRKTPRVYYHFAHLRTIQCFGLLRIYANFIVVEM